MRKYIYVLTVLCIYISDFFISEDSVVVTAPTSESDPNIKEGTDKLCKLQTTLRFGRIYMISQQILEILLFKHCISKQLPFHHICENMKTFPTFHPQNFCSLWNYKGDF